MPLAVELDRALGDIAALGPEQVGYGLERRRLAGAVGPQQSDDATLRHFERDTLEHQDDVVVDDLDVIDKERRRRLGTGRRFLVLGRDGLAHGAIAMGRLSSCAA